MSIQAINQIIDRVKTATRDSQLAIFRVRKMPGYLDCMFASTVKTQDMIAHADQTGYIGSYDNSFNLEALRSHLIAESQKNFW